MYLLLLVLDPGGVAVGDPFVTIGLPIIAVAVLAILTVLVSILLTYFYRRLVFILIIAVEHMLGLRYFHILTLLFTSNGVYLFSFTFRRRLRGKQKKVSSLVTCLCNQAVAITVYPG